MYYFRWWAEENPHWNEPRNVPHPEHVIAWVGIIDDQVIGPYFFDGYINSNSYAQMVTEYVIPELEDRGIDPREVIYMHDGAPPHKPNFVQDMLNQHFRGFIGPGDIQKALLKWPARSPDLNPLDFFLWGFVKDMVFLIENESIDELKFKIDEALDNITEQMLINVQINAEFRLNFCIDNNGEHFEHLM